MLQRLNAFIKVLRESRSPVKTIVGQILAKTGLHKFFTIRMDGYKLKFSNSALAITLFANSGDRHDDEGFLKKILSPGDTYVDVGANIGTLLLTAATVVSSNGKAIGIEAHPATFNNLRANIELNKFSNTIAIHSAVGNQKGSIFFSDINSDDQNKVLVKNQKGIEVKLDTLDHLLEKISVIHLLKIDVEGYEKFVLEGAVETIHKTVVVLYESWEKHFEGFGYSTSDVTNLLVQNGFSVFKLNGDVLKQLPVNYKSVDCENLVAVKDIHAFCSRYSYVIDSNEK